MHNETKKLLLKNAIASAIIALVISFISVTFSTVQAQRYVVFLTSRTNRYRNYRQKR